MKILYPRASDYRVFISPPPQGQSAWNVISTTGTSSVTYAELAAQAFIRLTRVRSVNTCTPVPYE
jgi:hypothetical protein